MKKVKKRQPRPRYDIYVGAYGAYVIDRLIAEADTFKKGANTDPVVSEHLFTSANGVVQKRPAILRASIRRARLNRIEEGLI